MCVTQPTWQICQNNVKKDRGAFMSRYVFRFYVGVAAQIAAVNTPAWLTQCTLLSERTSARTHARRLPSSDSSPLHHLHICFNDQSQWSSHTIVTPHLVLMSPQLNSAKITATNLQHMKCVYDSHFHFSNDITWRGVSVTIISAGESVWSLWTDKYCAAARV